ncbi:unnamed protein product [Vitrella brassicaformis CCMP3155]|uniref:Sulfotransferase domain-containing protein n=1 Tax=Vitrella brassicaformis (strain CCMP3155) TaxID=1169540 RepID=A0A0G4G3Y2_VITBC|nr:unnamed protein product [Vitrella brassicaformis CCMP3155]|eukprot:CEM22793.1 unnamed protein product [Vitrella brassicaformis CCMP3155]
MKAKTTQIGEASSLHVYDIERQPKLAELWRKIAEDGVASPESIHAVDWDGVFRGYRAAVGYPAALYYKELLRKYPGARVIVTTRGLDGWFESAERTVFRLPSVLLSFPAYLSTLVFHQHALVSMHLALDKARKWFEGDRRRGIIDREKTIERHRGHLDSIIQHINPRRAILFYQIEQGWGPLCKFLMCEQPDQPFPRVGSHDEYAQQLLMAQLLGWAILACAGATTMLVASTLMRGGKSK